MPGNEVQLLLDSDVPAVYDFLPGSEYYHVGQGLNLLIADLIVVVDASDEERIGKRKIRMLMRKY